MNFCIPGLTSIGTGSDLAGTSRGASDESSAIVAADRPAKGTEARAASVSLVHLFSGMSVSFPYIHFPAYLDLGWELVDWLPCPRAEQLEQKACLCGGLSGSQILGDLATRATSASLLPTHSGALAQNHFGHY
jgi:hypothetical protein